MATRIYRTSTAGSTTTWTWSGWIKRGIVSSGNQTLFAGVTDGNNWTEAYFKADDLLYIENNDSSSITGRLITSRKFRDPGAWMHIVVVWDTTNGTAGDRMRLYVNGVEETAFGTDTNPGSSQASILNEASSVTSVGGHSLAAEDFYGEMSHVQFVDGAALAPTEFGEVDSTSGIWKIKTGAYATPGTNGFFLKMEDRTNLDLDSSSNAFTMTTSGTLTATYDNPSNNFCTVNPLDNYYAGSTFSNGNNTIATANNGAWSNATMGLVSGKWYWETKCTVGGTDSWIQGIASTSTTSTANYIGENANNYGYFANGQTYTGGSGSAYGNTYGVDDIIGNYLDLDNNKMYWAINGTVQNSGTGLSITAPASTLLGAYFPAVGDWSTAQNYTIHTNFGNGYFGTTAVTSAVADAGGIGAFEYDPSAGTFDSASKNFMAVCTKNIKAYG
jgi:hypothetical protein|tara:strand:- start:397 stop:1728 length:1332 start_codon:yes stop_codon:yes gene_type:complete